MTERTCSRCKQIKQITEFYIKNKDPIIYRSDCKTCKNKSDYAARRDRKKYIPRKMTKYPDGLTRSEKNKLYYLNNKEKIDKYHEEYNALHKEDAKTYAINYRIKFKDRCKESDRRSKLKNKENVAERKRKYIRLKRKNDPTFKIRSIISREISRQIKKNGVSFLKQLDYTVTNLKTHLESMFEPWMAWSNWGRYDPKTWKEDDSSTWTWNIDHIIPQSDLFYTSYDDENFKKCWALTNLRPYSAKQNILDGSYRVRHKKEK